MKLFWLSFLLSLTIGRNEVWKSEESLWASTVVASPAKARVHMALGNRYADTHRDEEALAQYAEAFRLADNQSPFFYQAAALVNMGRIYLDRGDLQKAGPFFVRALEFNPSSEQAEINMAVILMRLGKSDLAMTVLNRASIEHPDSWAILFNQSEALRAQGFCQQAVGYFEQAKKSMPDLPQRPCFVR